VDRVPEMVVVMEWGSGGKVVAVVTVTVTA
jgi:hypothetical protein